MTPDDFRRRILSTRMDVEGKTARACQSVLINGSTMAEAGRIHGVAAEAVSRAVGKIRKAEPVNSCPHCKRKL